MWQLLLICADNERAGDKMTLVLASSVMLFLLEKDNLKKTFLLLSSFLLLAVYQWDYVPVCIVLFGSALWLAAEHLKEEPVTAKIVFGLGVLLLLIMNGIIMEDYRAIRLEAVLYALCYAGVSAILCGINRKNAKTRLAVFVFILAAGLIIDRNSIFSIFIPAAVFFAVRFGAKPFLRVADGIKEWMCDKNRKEEYAEEGDTFMTSKRGKLVFGTVLLMIPVMAAFVFCIYKLNHKINSVYLITQQIMDEMEKQKNSQAEDDFAADRTGTYIGNKPKDFTISRFTEADGMSFVTCDTGSEETYRLYQLNLNEEAGGLGYVLELPSGGLVVFDGGYEGDGPRIRDFIVEHGGTVSAWILTHPHYDHIGAFLYCMTEAADDMEVQSVYYSPFTAEFFAGEEYADNELENEALRFEEFEKLRKESSDIPYIAVSAGDRIQVENLLFKCLSGFDAGRKGVNDNSLVLRIEMNGVSMLITGDMTEATVKSMISEIGEDSADWDVDFVQIPHHGYTGTGREFYELTNPRFALLDCSTQEYENDVLNIRSETIKALHEMGTGVVKRFEGTNVVVIK